MPSSMNVMITRLVKKPRLSLTTIGVFSSSRAMSSARPTATSLVCLQRHVLERHCDPRLGARICDAGAHHPRAEDHGSPRAKRLEIDSRAASAALALDALEVEERRLDHVLRDLAGGEVDEVALF